MATMDVFNNNAFSVTSLTGKVDKIDYQPSLLGSLGLFENYPVTGREVFVDRREGKQRLIQTSQAGQAPEELTGDDRSAVSLRTVRLAKSATIYADEVSSVRAYNSMTESESIEAMVIRKMDRLLSDMELTKEYHRLAAIQGKLIDADGTLIYDYEAAFNETIPAATTFNLSSNTFKVRTACNNIVRSMSQSSKGAMNGATVHALIGNDAFDALVDHEEVRETYKNWAAASDLRQGTAYEAFTYGGITFHNYRGTDDGTTVAIPATAIRFFPVGGRDIFTVAWSPINDMDYVNTPGQSMYAKMIRDWQRNEWVKPEIYSLPLYFCQRPDILRSGTAT